MIWNKEMECADRETMRALQLKKLKETVKYEYDNVPYYREKMDKAGVKPEDIQTLEDIRKLPFCLFVCSLVYDFLSFALVSRKCARCHESYLGVDVENGFYVVSYLRPELFKLVVIVKKRCV